MTEMSPQQWLQAMRQFDSVRNWHAWAQLRRQTNQRFAQRLDALGLDLFYREVLRLLNTDSARAALASNATAFEQAIARAMPSVHAGAQAEGNIQGVYFEYYFDGRQDDDTNAGNFFLCTEYADDSDHWGAEFGAAGMVQGAGLPDFFFVAQDAEDDVVSAVLEEAANGRLLAALLKVWADQGMAGMPAAFANHDHEMVRFRR